MGWNLCIATENDRNKAKLLKQNQALNDDDYDDDDEDEDDEDEDEYDLFYEGITSLSRHFSYALLRDHGQFRKWLSDHEVQALEPNSLDDPDRWQPRDPQQILEILCRLRKRLERENEQMPVDHFLWYVDEQGRRWKGATQITLPFGGIQLKVPNDPIVKLDGGHHDPDHRWELRKYDVRVDANLLAQLNRESEDIRTKHGDNVQIANDAYVSRISYVSRIDPLVNEPVGWIPVQPVIEVLGYRVEVKSENALARFQPDLNSAIECCEQAICTGSPIYWLMES